MDSSAGYLRTPTIAGDTIAFVTEDDLWAVPAAGGTARRLTANLSEVTRPSLSPDGEWVAFTSREEHHPEVYVMPAAGGVAARLTWLGATSFVRGWTPGGDILFASDQGQPFAGDHVLRTVPPTGGPVGSLPWGPASEAAWSPEGAVVLGRHTADPARWKRYRGGLVGRLWIDQRGDGGFRPLLGGLDGNIAHPMFVGGRVWFVSDHEGIGNLYSCRPDGRDVRRHTDHDRYYARMAASDGRRVVYTHGADVWLLDPTDGQARPVTIDLRSPRIQRQRKFVPAARYLTGQSLHPDGHSVAIESRGKVFTMGLFEGAVRQLGTADGVRYRFPRWIGDGTRIVCISDEGGEDAIEVHPSGVAATVPNGAPAGSGGQSSPLGAPEGPASAPASGPAPAAPASGAAPAAPTRRRRPRGETPLIRGRAVTIGQHQRLDGLDLGCVTELAAAPRGGLVAVTNHRYELVVIDVDDASARRVDHSPHGALDGLAWSSDGQWLAYSIATTRQTRSIKLYSVASAASHMVTPPEFRDFAPAWDPEGRYLYFLSSRVFNPVADELYFDLSFPRPTRPYLVTLRADLPSPFLPSPRPPGNGPAPKPATPPPSPSAVPGSPGADAAVAESAVAVDVDDIEQRVVPFPLDEGRYTQIAGIGAKVLFATRPIEGRLQGDWTDTSPTPTGSLESFDLTELRHETLLGGIVSFEVSRDSSTLLYDAGHRLRALKAGDKPAEGADREGPGRRSGWVDLDRVRVSVDPGAEWRQMFGEAWRLQRDHFWVGDMSGVDWNEVRRRYLPLVDRVATRLEFSDLMWEMQGELGTSHAYELGGDYRPAPRYALGQLGADLTFDARTGRWRVARVLGGDPWDPETASPLAGPGVNAAPGDAIVAVNGQPVTAQGGPAALLVNQAAMVAEVTLEPARGGPSRTVTIRTLRDERPARYRDWVSANRATVHAASDGRVGYVHIPDMGPRGYAEFHRAYLAEVVRDALIIDVRFNGGGNVSQLVLEKLARRRIGYDVTRWGPPEPYPADSPAGPLVVLTNEAAGSDGDIFTHCFKLMGLGPVVGKRTWGGVVGIWPRHLLADGGLTTQPEYSFWFTDVGWGVENRGTDPDYDVDIRPQDYAAGSDPQLEKGIQLVLRALRRHRPLAPDVDRRPRLALPVLPARPTANGSAKKAAPNAAPARASARRAR